MDTAIVIPIVVALSTLLGGALTAYVQLRNQRTNQQFQLASDAAKHEREIADREKSDVLKRKVEAHKLLSRMAREFSVTNLDILWRANMTDNEYDLRYLSACCEMDELRAFASLYAPSLADDIEKLHGQMNMFWGNFNNVLYQTSQGRKVDHTTPALTKAHEAANEIGAKAAFVKQRLRALGRNYEE